MTNQAHPLICETLPRDISVVSCLVDLLHQMKVLEVQITALSFNGQSEIVQITALSFNWHSEIHCQAMRSKTLISTIIGSALS